MFNIVIYVINSILSLTSNSDMTTVLASLTSDCRQDQCVLHALAVRSAWALNSYHRFFKLYNKAPKMSGYLMDWFSDKVRFSALKAIVKSYVNLVCYLTFVCFIDISLKIQVENYLIHLFSSIFNLLQISFLNCNESAEKLQKNLFKQIIVKGNL